MSVRLAAAWMWNANAVISPMRSNHSATVRGRKGTSSSRSHSP
jgi:hypothetical protein